jgi:hypothetical protein
VLEQYHGPPVERLPGRAGEGARLKDGYGLRRPPATAAGTRAGWRGHATTVARTCR